MDSDNDTTVSVIDGDPGGDVEAISHDNGILEGISSDEEVMREVGTALIGLELDLACCSEKLVNMNLLMMHVAARESDLEAFVSENEDTLVNSSEKALEYDILSGIFDSEVKEMDRFIGKLEKEINNARETISSHKHLRKAFSGLDEKLHDAEESMKQSQEQVSELMMQSAKFQRILSRFNRKEISDEDKDTVTLEDSDFFNTTTKIKMQTSEQQRHILRMLEKSLARELDLEKKLAECTQALYETKLRLRSSKQEVLSMEEEITSTYARFLEADNVAVLLMGTSKELMGQLQLRQLNINSAVRRENELNVRLQNCIQSVENLDKEKASFRELAEKNSSEALILEEKVKFLEEQLKASEERNVIAESRAERAEEERKFLEESDKELSQELNLLKGRGISIEKVNSLEEQLRQTDIQLQQAMTSVEASQEKQSMLYSSINDMEILIENLKSKVLKADARADSAEDKCIILSETNAELNEELNFLRGKLESLEASLQQAEERKLATAKEINIRTKVITDMVMQLAIEREHLQKQISLLMKDNRALVEKSHVANKAASNSENSEGEENGNGVLFSEHQAGSVASVDGNKEGVSDVFEVKPVEDVLDGECEDMKSKLERVRTIDAGRLSFKCVLSAILIALIAVVTVSLLQMENCPL